MEQEVVEQVLILDTAVLAWSLALLMPMAVAWCTSVFLLLRDIKKTSDQLLHMHINADDSGFGTNSTNKMIEDLRRGMREFIHYTRWTAKEMTGKEPPPPGPEL